MANLKNKTAKSAFTLIELLIVIVIIGILAGVVLAVIDPARAITRSNQSTARSIVSKACYAYVACLESSRDSINGAVDSTQCDTSTEVGLQTTLFNAAGTITRNGGTLGFFENGAVGTTISSTACGSAPTNNLCRPGWQTAACSFICENTGAITAREASNGCLIN